MHDLNSSLDALRQVMPYAHGPSVKKLSKMSTLLLARNYIVLLTRSLEEMRRLLADAYSRGSPPLIPGTPLPPVIPVANPLRPEALPANILHTDFHRLSSLHGLPSSHSMAAPFPVRPHALDTEKGRSTPAISPNRHAHLTLSNLGPHPSLPHPGYLSNIHPSHMKYTHVNSVSPTTN